MAQKSDCPDFDEDVRRVSLICPFANFDDIRKDLLSTGDVELTVNNFLDGTVLGGEQDDALGVQPQISESEYSPLGHVKDGGGCSSTDINTDSDDDYTAVQLPTLLRPDKTGRGDRKAVLSDKPSEVPEVPSDDDVQFVSHTPTVTVKPPPVSPVVMYGGHGISDSSEEDDLPSVSSPKALSVSSGDDLNVDESKPLSSLLARCGTKADNSGPTHTFDVVDSEELPDLDPVEYMETDSLQTDSLQSDCIGACSSEWSQRSAGSVSLSQTSGVSTTSAEPGNKGKKRRRTPEEIAECKRQAELRKLQREQERKEKEERKKRDMLAKKAMQEAKKQLRPGDCMKYMTVVVDLGVINAGPGAAVLAAFNDSEVRCVAEALPVPNTITWRRKQVEHRMAEDGSFRLVETEQTEPEVLVVLTTQDFLQLAENSKQGQHGTQDGPTLVSHVKYVQRVYDDRRVTLLALGMAQYFRQIKTDLQRQHREAVRTAGQEAPSKRRNKQQNKIIMSRIEIEEVLVGLQLETDCNYQLIETSKDLSDLVKTFTKGVAEAPLKKDRLESAFSFHCEGGGVGRVDKNGAGLLKVWKQQLQQFKTISTEMANSIISSYPSPRLLVEAYRRCSSEREAERLLEDIVVRRGAGALTTNRRIGKELSRRVYQLFNMTDPEFVIP